MAATCAVCLGPIVTRDDIRISGTEVMHRSCAASGRETIGWRNQREVAELRMQLTQAQERATREQRAAERARLNNRTLERMLAAANEGSRIVLADANTERAQTAQTMAKLLQERDVALAEFAKRSAPVAETNPDQTDKMDDTEARFSLLELD